MKRNIILYLLLICVFIKLFWNKIAIEAFNYQKECTNELADSIATKRESEKNFKLAQAIVATEQIPTSLNNLEDSLYNIRGGVPQGFDKEDMYKSLMNTVIDNALKINEKDKLAVSKGNVIDTLSRFEIILNDGALSNLAEYKE